MLVGRSEVRPRSRAREAFHADQAHPVVLDQHEAARVGTGQVAQAGGDPVEHGVQVALGVHVGDHVAELADDPGTLGHVVPGRGVLAGAVTHVHPADDLTGAVPQRAGVDAQVEQLAVLAGTAGHVGDLAAGAHPLQGGVVLGLEFLGDQRRFLAEYLGGAPAEHPLGSRVPQQHGSLGAESHDGIGRALDHRARGRIHAVLARYHRFGSHPCIVPSPARSGPQIPRQDHRAASVVMNPIRPFGRGGGPRSRRALHPVRRGLLAQAPTSRG